MAIVSTDKKGFTPVTLNVTLETKKELDLLASLFNFTPICKILRENGGRDLCFICDALTSKGANPHGDEHSLFVDILQLSQTEPKIKRSEPLPINIWECICGQYVSKGLEDCPKCTRRRPR